MAMLLCASQHGRPVRFLSGILAFHSPGCVGSHQPESGPRSENEIPNPLSPNGARLTPRGETGVGSEQGWSYSNLLKVPGLLPRLVLWDQTVKRSFRSATNSSFHSVAMRTAFSLAVPLLHASPPGSSECFLLLPVASCCFLWWLKPTRVSFHVSHFSASLSLRNPLIDFSGIMKNEP